MIKTSISKIFGILNTKRKTKDLLIECSDDEKLFTALASEKSLAKGWNSKEEDKAWKKLKSKK